VKLFLRCKSIIIHPISLKNVEHKSTNSKEMMEVTCSVWLMFLCHQHFLQQLFCVKFYAHLFIVLEIKVNTFNSKKIYRKALLKMLAKSTTGRLPKWHSDDN
jgi:hypothetical protein